MAITYNTNILHLKGAPSFQDLTNVIKEVEFEVVAVDGDYTHNSMGHISVELNEDSFKNSSSLNSKYATILSLSTLSKASSKSLSKNG